VADWLAEVLGAIPGLDVERPDPDPTDVRADPDWPGREMPPDALPIVLGRLGEPGGRRIVLVGHTDVVLLGDPGPWSVDPAAGDVRDGQLYGRGACDMKGGVAATLAAVRAIAAAGLADDLTGEVLVAFVPSEEDAGQAMLAAIRAGATGDLGVNSEPSGLDIVVAHAGALAFRLTVPGRAAHASRRREGVSALDKLWVLSRAIEADEARRNEAETDPLMTDLGMPYPTIIGKVHGGEWASTVIDRVVAEGRRVRGSWRPGSSASSAEAAAPATRSQRAATTSTSIRYGGTSPATATVARVGGSVGKTARKTSL
jgi:acetylornithine deacetylase